jgi:N-acyl-D-aspartate/D-glutamate deacylase
LSAPRFALGLVGLGTMGGALAERLLEQEFALVACSYDEPERARFARRHGFERTVSDSAALARLTAAPAGILGRAAGRLVKGAAADLLILDPDRAWRVREAEFRSKSKNSPFDGRPLQGRVLRTLVNGETIFRRED